MIASLIEPVSYDRMASLQLLLGLGLLVLALFVILALGCLVYGALRGFATHRRVRK